MQDFASDIVKYKAYIETSFVNCSNNVGEQVMTLARRLNGHDTAVTSMDHNFAMTAAQLQSLSESLEELNNHLASERAQPRGPEHYAVNTPVESTSNPGQQQPTNLPLEPQGDNGGMHDQREHAGFLRAQGSSNQAFPGCGPPARSFASLVREQTAPAAHFDSQGARAMPGSFMALTKTTNSVGIPVNRPRCTQPEEATIHHQELTHGSSAIIRHTILGSDCPLCL